MVSQHDPLMILAGDVRRRQLLALEAHAPATFAGYEARMARATADGMAVMHEMVASGAVPQELLATCLQEAEIDPRFAFLKVVPDAPVLAIARAQALETAIFGAIASTEVTALALLVSLFTILLDGLLDEAPDILAPEREYLQEMMIGQPWAEQQRRYASAAASPSNRHPITRLLFAVMDEIILRVVSAPPWTSERLLRREFKRAARDAYQAELRSERCTLDATLPRGDAYRDALRAKSINWARITALVPLCLHGWPDWLDPAGYEQLGIRLGIFGGWIDDIADVVIDLRDRRWSNVLLELARSLPATPSPAMHDLRTVLVQSLAQPWVQEQLALTGIRAYDEIAIALGSLRINPAPLLPVLADITRLSLSPSELVTA